MGKNRRGRRGKKSNKPKELTTGEVCSSTGEHYHSSDDHDETDIACYVFTDDGFYTTRDPEVIAQNNRDMETPAPPLYIKCRGKKWRDLHEELRFKAVFEFTAKCLDNDRLLELQLANMYDYKAVKSKIAKYIVPAPGNTEEKKLKEKFVKKKTEEKEKPEEKETTEEQKTVKKKKSKPVKALLRGLPWLCDEEGVRDGLLYEGFGDVAVKLHNRTNKKKPPLFKLAIDTGEDARRRKDADKVFELTKLLGFEVTVEPLPEEFDPQPQCFKCQQEGHVAKYCRNRAKCVKCAGFHDSRTCPLKKEDPPTCARCGGPHVASWRGCPVFQGLIQAIGDESSSDEADSSEEEDHEIVEQLICCEKHEEIMTEPAEPAIVLSLPKKKNRRRRLRKPPCVLRAQLEAAIQANLNGEEPGETTEQANCSEKAQDETAEQANSSEKTQSETAQQQNADCDVDAKKKKRRRKRRGKPAEQGEAEQATDASPPRDEDPTSGGGGGKDARTQEKVAAMTTGDNKVSAKELEGDIVAAVSRLVTERLSATVLETVQAALKAAK